MAYEIKEIVQMMKVYHTLESEAKDFMFISAASMKNKDYKIKRAETLLKAIEEYKKLPNELKVELEKDKTTTAYKIVELEKLCKEAIKVK